MICIHEVIYSVCSRNFCGILSTSEDFMTHDEMMSLLANTLADAAGHAGCLPILDCFSPHPGEEVTVSIPMCDDTVDIVLEDLDFPHEWEELLENSGADTMGDLVDYLCYCSQNNGIHQQTRRRLTLDLKPGSGSSNLQTSAKIQRIKICTRPLRRLRPRR